MDEREKEIKAEVIQSNKNTEEVVKIIDSEKTEQAVKVLEKNSENSTKSIDNKIETNKIENNQKTQFKVNETYRLKQSKYKKDRKFVVLGIIIVVCIIALALFSTIFALINANNNTILSGIYARGILIEGLTEEEALKMLNDKIQEEKTREIILKINEETYSITPEQIEVEYNVEKAVQQAYQIGRDGNIFQNNFAIFQTMLEENFIDIEVTYNEELLTNVLEGFNAKLPNAMVDNTYCVEEDELIITRGIDGLVIDIDNAKQVIMDSIKNGKSEEIEVKTKLEKCPDIDIEAIYEKVKSEPQDASYKTDPFEIIPHKNGLDFDIEGARKIISEEKEEYVIKLNVIEPDILTNELGEEAFPDLLGAFSTKYDETNVPRTKNVKLAMSKLDGVVVMPGEVFSYNQTLGKRTAEAGYEYANGFAGGKVVPMLAGGICQVSSTLYDAVLYANLNIVERYNHMFQATYVEPGKDATVVYGSLDFKFENTRNYPIMIKAKAGGGLADIKIFGIREEVEYEVDIVTTILSYTPYKEVVETDYSLAPGQEKVSQWGLKGCKSITHRILRLNGQEISREVLSTDTYDPLNKITKKGPTYSQTPTVDTSTTPQETVTTPEEEAAQPQETPATEQVTPENPEVSPTPEEPETPEIPETPETPEEPATSENPETPTNP